MTIAGSRPVSQRSGPRPERMVFGEDCAVVFN